MGGEEFEEEVDAGRVGLGQGSVEKLLEWLVADGGEDDFVVGVIVIDGEDEGEFDGQAGYKNEDGEIPGLERRFGGHGGILA